MKKALTVSAVLITVLLVFTAQNSLAQKDPFEIGKEIAMTGNFSSPVWLKKTGNFGATYNTELNAVAFAENPGSGNGTVVWWIKDLGPNTYLQYTFTVKNYEVQQETAQEVSIKKEKAEHLSITGIRLSFIYCLVTHPFTVLVQISLMREDALLFPVFLFFLLVCLFLLFCPFLFFLYIQDNGTAFTMFALFSELATTFLFRLFFLFSHGSPPAMQTPYY